MVVVGQSKRVELKDGKSKYEIRAFREQKGTEDWNKDVDIIRKRA